MHHPSICNDHGSEKIFAAAVEHGFFGECAGGDEARDFPFDDACGIARRLAAAVVFHLFADGDLESGGDHAVKVGIDGVVGNTGHGNRIFTLGTAGEGDAEDAGDGAGVFVEAFIEIAHAEEKDGIGVLLFVLLVLAHGGREGGRVDVVDGVAGGGLGGEYKRVWGEAQIVVS